MKVKKLAKFIIGITGASGSIYAKRLLEVLLTLDHDIHLIISNPGFQVLKSELGWELTGNEEEISRQISRYLKISPEHKGCIKYFANENIGATIASGSYKTGGMIILPCSMSTLAGVAIGTSTNLIQRAADIMLKEKRPLVIVPREAPLNAIHLRNMLTLAELGVQIIPAMPAFYFKPTKIEDLVDFIVGRILDYFNVEHNLFPRWEG
jgi:flavin prenyltransferase